MSTAEPSDPFALELSSDQLDPSRATGLSLPGGIPDLAELTAMAQRLFGELGAELAVSSPELAAVAIPGADHSSAPQLDIGNQLHDPTSSLRLDPTQLEAVSSRTDPQPLSWPAAPASPQPLDPAHLRRDFPILQERINGHPLVWLDNGATTQKPQAVIDRLAQFYRHENSNIHRGAHALAARATDAYEQARSVVGRFLNAGSSEEIVFVRGSTEAINLVAQSWGRREIHAGDEIVLTELEHHANIVPWQQLVHETGARLRVAPVDDSGQVILEEYERLFSSRTRLAAFTQVSNALGTITPIESMIAIAHRHGARVLVDGAQGIAHTPVDVQALDADFYAFSGHKIYAPTGIGVLYGKRELLAAMPPWQGGGNMIRDVRFERTLYQDPPHRFEAGTGNIADAVGLATALEYVSRIGMHAIEREEQALLAYATPLLQDISGLRLFGCASHKAGVLSFTLEGCAPEAVGSALNRQGIAVRAGHHCAQPILRRFGVESTVRATFALYNTRADVDALVAGLRSIRAQGASLLR
ncbi:MAG: SufS family cysteine desulfurase [Prochlorococcaceae cyanobacterium]